MSTTGDSTCDWLLSKLLKASSNLAEQQVEIETLKRIMEDGNDAFRDLQSQLVEARLNSTNETNQLRERVCELTNNRQIEVHYQRSPLGLDNVKLHILSISSSNGETTITVTAPRDTVAIALGPLARSQG